MSNPKKRSNLGRHIAPDHKRMSRMIGYCLTLQTSDAWLGFSKVASAKLDATERASLAWAALMALKPEHVELTAAAVLKAAGSPLPAFLGGLDEARFWASCATRSELKAYALAAHDAMSAQDQAAFFQHISEVEIAA
ncbi:hypothetical protein K3759_05135 [Sulfitobacter sp. W027]|uniref:hypothetical protein n=1 Tax=Sulfitobacter sp. W027 TaxID=2867025 RepID=UPI0021A3904A|nr:hypothetical protein [Sulfitobacter sp. W027]UWR34477.1 hypothetical protein K3759_05135 [Sulfitobacter sp. W027]